MILGVIADDFTGASDIAAMLARGGMQTELVITMSMTMVTIAGPAARAPSKATSKGTPMKPVFGKAATSAPKDASFQPMRLFLVTAMANPTITSAQNR